LPDDNRWQRIFYQAILAVGLLALALWLVVRLSVVTAPLIVGVAIAWALNPLVIWLRRHKVPAFVALTVPLLMLIVFVVVIVAVIMPAGTRELLRASQSLPGRLHTTVLQLDPWLFDLVGVKLSHLVAPETLRANMQQVLGEVVGSATSVVTWVLSRGRDVLVVVGNTLLVFVIAAFLLDDWDRILNNARGLVPPRHREHAAEVAGRIDATLASFLRAELVLYLLASTLFTGGLLLLKVPLAALLGPFVGAIYLVPYIGVLLGALLALTVALIESPSLFTFVGVSVLFGGFYGIDAVFITPRIIGGRVGLRPLVVLLGIFAGGELFGVIGVLLAIPSLAVGRIVLLEFVARYRTSRAYLGPAQALGRPPDEQGQPASVSAAEQPPESGGGRPDDLDAPADHGPTP